MNIVMAFPKILKTAFHLLTSGRWREFYIRALIVLGILDIKTVTTNELNLSSERAHSYSDSGREDLQAVLSALEIKEGDAIVDFGCGKGGAVIVMAEFPFSKITGLEISKGLLKVARKNLKILGISNVDFICCDAADFDDLDEYNYAYFYNPFPCNIMNSVVDNIKASLARKHRKFTIIYLNPVCHEMIVKENLFSKTKEMDHFSHCFYIYMNNLKQ